MDGYLLINKPLGIYSFGVVAKVRGIWRQELRAQGLSPKKAKIGHTGTLDPAASGLMILVLGSYTKKAAEFSKMDKVYEVEMTLGQTSSTGDSEGELSKTSDNVPPNQEVETVLKKFKGDIMQMPPVYSAIKVGGVRAYKLAREGKEVMLEPRLVTIHSIEDLSYQYPILKFTAHTGSGTYIRSLVEDIGEALKVGAYMTKLNRTKVGPYTLEDSIGIDNLSINDIINSIKQIPIA